MSSIIVAVGKLEAGLRPYVDFRSTMQSATYVLNWLVEAVFGAHYLGLVKGGLLLALVGGTTLALLWRPVFGALGAVLLAGAVTLGGLSQHVFIFYNTVGLLCLAVVVAGLATEPRLWPLRRWDRWLVCAALVVGGTNKINFHALTLGLAGLLMAQGWLAGRCTPRALVASLASLFAAGVVVPLAVELAWTGAAPRVWFFNIFELPSERVGFALAGFKAELLWEPPYDVHHSLPFKAFNAAGLALLATVSALIWMRTVRPLTRGRRLIGTVSLAALCLAVAVGGLLLTTTNVETIALTSLAFPVGAAALVAAFRPKGSPGNPRFATRFVPAASLLWTFVGGYAAWQGSRVMFGEEPPRRTDYVRWTDPGPTGAYLRGVRLEPGWRDSLVATVRELERIQIKDTSLKTVLFGPAFEWMERAHPGSIVPGMPVWYHHGTSLSSEDGAWLEQALQEKGVDRLVLNPHWESWPGSFWLRLADDFRAVDLGRFARVYERRTAPRQPAFAAAAVAFTPWSFRESTGSNVHWLSTTMSPGTALYESPWGRVVGRVGGMDWIWRRGAYLAQGNFVAMLQGESDESAEVTCRIENREGESVSVLFEHTITLTAANPEARLPFVVSAGGRPLTLTMTVAPENAQRVLCGWRDLRIGHAASDATAPPVTLAPLLASPEAGFTSFPSVLRIREADPATIDGWFAAPFETWQPVAAERQHATVTIDLQRRPDGTGHPTLLTLAWYKAGRIEFLQQAVVNPGDQEQLELSAALPEAGGWVGLLARAADPTAEPNIRARPPTWRW